MSPPYAHIHTHIHADSTHMDIPAGQKMCEDEAGLKAGLEAMEIAAKQKTHGLKPCSAQFWAMLAECWAMLEPCWGHVGAMLRL